MPLPACVRSTLEVCVYFSAWYAPSLGLTMFNKWFFTSWHGGFGYPILVTTVHFASNSVWSALLLTCFPSRFPAPDPQQITWRGYLVSIVPIGVATATDIVLSNQAYIYMTVTLMTIVKSAGPCIMLVWAFALKLEEPSKALMAVMVVITAGALLAVLRFDDEEGSGEEDRKAKKLEAAEEAFGIMLLVIAMVCSGGRWACTQLLLQAGYTKMHPLVALRYTAPVCVLTLVPGFFAFEFTKLRDSKALEQDYALTTILLVLSASLLALILILAEFSIIGRYSAISMTIGGVVKEFLTIGVAIAFLNEALEWNKFMGAILVILAVVYYTWLKMGQTQARSGQFQRVQYASAPTMPIPKLELSISGADDTELSELPTSQGPVFEIEHDDDDTEAMELLKRICEQANDHEHSMDCQA